MRVPQVKKVLAAILWLVPAIDIKRRGNPVIGIVYLVAAPLLILFIEERAAAEKLHAAFWDLIVDRTIHLGSGVSPLLPIPFHAGR